MTMRSGSTLAVLLLLACLVAAAPPDVLGAAVRRDATGAATPLDNLQAAAPSQLVFADLFIPLVFRGVTLAELPTPPLGATLTPTSPPTATATPTDIPTATATPTPTEVRPTGRIHGHMTVDGQPMAAGFGVPPYPQIELHKRVSGEWERVVSTVTTEGGAFEFLNPPALGPGEVYRVVWLNDVDTGFGSDIWVHRWWSRNVAVFGSGEDIDIGTFELADLRYLSPCHDCHQTLPITYKWSARANKSDVYRWRLYKGCGSLEDRYNFYETQSLGRATEYTLNSPPPTYTYDTTYCWYIFISDGENGTGWPFHTWRTAFLSGASLWPADRLRLCPGLPFCR